MTPGKTLGKTRRILFVAPRSISQRGIPSKFSSPLKLLYNLHNSLSTPSNLSTFSSFSALYYAHVASPPMIVSPALFTSQVLRKTLLSTSWKHPAQGLSRCQYQTWSPLPPTCLLVSPRASMVSPALVFFPNYLLRRRPTCGVQEGGGSGSKEFSFLGVDRRKAGHTHVWPVLFIKLIVDPLSLDILHHDATPNYKFCSKHQKAIHLPH